MASNELDPIYFSAGRLLKAAREEAGLSREDCARAVGLKSAVAMLRYESGKRKLPLHMIPVLAQMLGKDISYFFQDGDTIVAGGATPSVSGIKSEGRKFDVFISYCWQDKAEVETIVNSLKAQGYRPWIDFEQIAPGGWFQDVIQDVIAKVRSLAVFVGPAGLGKLEIVELRALMAQCVDTSIPVIPVLLPGAENVPRELPFLKELQCVRFENGIEDEKALDALIWGITGNRPRRTSG